MTAMVNIGPGRHGTVSAAQANPLRQIGAYLTACASRSTEPAAVRGYPKVNGFTESTEEPDQPTVDRPREADR